jgi:carbamoyl-phosphate synthase small subunit
MIVAKLVLSNGMVFKGRHIGAQVQTSGELVFTTSMVGYSESITDPSFCGQILTFSYPLIGNYGLPNIVADENKFHLAQGYESDRSWLSGVILSSNSDFTGHQVFETNLDEWLKKINVPGIVGIDTRELVKVIRDSSMLLGQIVLEENGLIIDNAFAMHPFKLENDSFTNPNLENLVDKVSSKKRVILGKGKTKVGIIDFGVKWGIINRLLEMDCRVEVIPWNERFSQIDCDGYLLSNGPGDPVSLKEIFPEIRELINSNKKILGICLGHQVMALAMGAQTKRLPFGHRGYNQPVVEMKTSRGFMTCQNHSYYVCEETLDHSAWDVSFINANDRSIEGISHKTKPVKGIQFHPEASGGPNDCLWILDEFVRSLR